jgi:hypothetical protein
MVACPLQWQSEWLGEERGEVQQELVHHVPFGHHEYWRHRAVCHGLPEHPVPVSHKRHGSAAEILEDGSQ